jgi:Asp-tRNA(Asn)/Glu-tRNA(Gln) amidotransferase A subunit family amidase
MDTKLTLKLDQKLIARAEQFAEEHNISISKLVERYLDQITRNDQLEEPEAFTSLVKRLYGIAPIPEAEETENAYFEHLLKKHSP